MLKVPLHFCKHFCLHGLKKIQIGWKKLLNRDLDIELVTTQIAKFNLKDSDEVALVLPGVSSWPI